MLLGIQFHSDISTKLISKSIFSVKIIIDTFYGHFLSILDPDFLWLGSVMRHYGSKMFHKVQNEAIVKKSSKIKTKRWNCMKYTAKKNSETQF